MPRVPFYGNRHRTFPLTRCSPVIYGRTTTHLRGFCHYVVSPLPFAIRAAVTTAAPLLPVSWRALPFLPTCLCTPVPARHAYPAPPPRFPMTGYHPRSSMYRATRTHWMFVLSVCCLGLVNPPPLRIRQHCNEQQRPSPYLCRICCSLQPSGSFNDALPPVPLPVIGPFVGSIRHYLQRTPHARRLPRYATLPRILQRRTRCSPWFVRRTRSSLFLRNVLRAGSAQQLRTPSILLTA